MTQFDNTNSGAIFANDRRRDDRSPTGKGSAEIQCPCCNTTTKFWISSWIKTSKAGDRFNSLAFTPDRKSDVQSPPTSEINFDDDIPF